MKIYKKGTFGYWWTVEQGKEDIEGKVYNHSIYCYHNQLTSLEGAPKEVGGDFICYNNQLTSLDGSPEKVGRSFYCDNNQLTSLEGCPKEVGRGFYCSHNQLTSLEGSPEKVGGRFDCDNNQLTSLEGSPEKVGGDFFCYNNQLTSLKGCPKEVGRDFNCYSNKLTSLKGCPKEVDGDFDCDNNQLTSLEGAPKEVGGRFDCSNNPIKTLPDNLNVKGNIYGDVYEWKGKIYSFFDGIQLEVKSQKKQKGLIVYKLEKGYAVYDGINYSHGETVNEAKEDLIYKISDRDTSKYEKMTLDTELTKKEYIEMYRVITGACEYGVRCFCEDNSDKLKDKMNIKEIIDVTKGQYGNNKLKEFFNKKEK